MDSSQPARKKRKLYLRDTTLTIPQRTRYRHSRQSTPQRSDSSCNFSDGYTEAESDDIS